MNILPQKLTNPAKTVIAVVVLSGLLYGSIFRQVYRVPILGIAISSAISSVKTEIIRDELRERDGYLLCYEANFRAHYMLREPANNIDDLKAQVADFFEEYDVINSLRYETQLTVCRLYCLDDNLPPSYSESGGDDPIEVCFIKPSVDLEYAECLENSYNFTNQQRAPLLRNTLCSVVIPPDAETFEDCKFKKQNHDYWNSGNWDEWDEESWREKLP